MSRVLHRNAKEAIYNMVVGDAKIPKRDINEEATHAAREDLLGDEADHPNAKYGKDAHGRVPIHPLCPVLLHEIAAYHSTHANAEAVVRNAEYCLHSRSPSFWRELTCILDR
mmetsp:Transcript_7612/g.12423  ORF Transcript_7612/g.12423 Transcript_7612/m.12423 type:complete len:112 (-) Transcript_7612:256-591(-)